LKPLKTTASLQAVEVSAMYTKKIKVSITFKTVRKVADESALIDSGNCGKFLNISVWKTLGILRPERPIPVHDMDGTANRRGGITDYCWLKVKVGERATNMRFDLTSLGKDRFIVGYPFLWQFNPGIDQKIGRLVDGEVRIEILGFRKAQKRVRSGQQEALKRCGKPEEGPISSNGTGRRLRVTPHS